MSFMVVEFILLKVVKCRALSKSNINFRVKKWITKNQSLGLFSLRERDNLKNALTISNFYLI